MSSISPISGTPRTIFIANLSDSKLNFTNITSTVSSGEIRIVEINESAKLIYFYLNDIEAGTKTISFTENESVSIPVYLKMLPTNIIRANYTETNAARPRWPYRTY